MYDCFLLRSLFAAFENISQKLLMNGFSYLSLLLQFGMLMNDRSHETNCFSWMFFMFSF